MTYEQFLAGKSQLGGSFGFNPLWMPSFLFDFQSALLEWQLSRGRGAIFADCGLGKTPMQLEWAQQISAAFNAKPVLILAPLAVAEQTQREGMKFG